MKTQTTDYKGTKIETYVSAGMYTWLIDFTPNRQWGDKLMFAPEEIGGISEFVTRWEALQAAKRAVRSIIEV